MQSQEQKNGIGMEAKKLENIQNQCWNGSSCKFKPRCQFYHPEGKNRTKTKRKTNDRETRENQMHVKNNYERLVIKQSGNERKQKL